MSLKRASRALFVVTFFYTALMTVFAAMGNTYSLVYVAWGIVIMAGSAFFWHEGKRNHW